MKNEFFLEISIPTYNRPKSIVSQVRSILPQLTEEVGLVVRDNKSLIPVKTLFTEQELQKFKLIENSQNIGGDGNILECFKNSRGRWIWVLGDDDILFDNIINKVVQFLKSLDEEVCYVNFGAKSSGNFIGFNSFVNEINSPKALGNCFWISKCVYRDYLRDNSLFYYYSNLSSMIGQFICVLKYLENETSGKNVVAISEMKLFDDSPNDVSWSHIQFIKRTMIALDAFENKHLLCHSIFKALLITHLMMLKIMIDKKNIKFKDFISMFFLIQNRYGFYSIIKMTKFLCFKLFVYAIIKLL